MLLAIAFPLWTASFVIEPSSESPKHHLKEAFGRYLAEERDGQVLALVWFPCCLLSQQKSFLSSHSTG